MPKKKYYPAHNDTRRLRRHQDPEYRARINAAAKVAYRRRREYNLRYAYVKKYGITWEDRDALLAAQGGCCKICRSPDHGAKSRGWHTDHDPTKQKGEPGFIRGILCLKCNIGLGQFNHNVELMDQGALYLLESIHAGQQASGIRGNATSVVAEIAPGWAGNGFSERVPFFG